MRNKIIFAIFFCLLFGLIGMIWFDKKQNDKNKNYVFEINFLNGAFYLKITASTNDNDKINNLINQSKDKVNKVEKLISKEKHVDGLINLYDIKNNDWNEEYLTLDDDLVNLLKLGLEWYQKSDHYFDIGTSKLNKDWDNNFASNLYEIPSYESDVERLTLDDNKVLNNHLDLDLDALARGYLVDWIGNLLEENKLFDYFINADYVVKMGFKDDGSYYKVALGEPNGEEGSVYEFLKLKNQAYASLDFYDKVGTIDSKQYTGYINPIKKEPEVELFGTTVLGKTAVESVVLSYVSFFKQESCLDLLKSYGAEAIWYYSENDIRATDGFEKSRLGNKK